MTSGPGTTRPGAPQDCPAGPVDPPDALRAVRGLHAVSIVSATPPDAGCVDRWAVTLFVDATGRVRGVLLRLGSP